MAKRNTPPISQPSSSHPNPTFNSSTGGSPPPSTPIPTSPRPPQASDPPKTQSTTNLVTASLLQSTSPSSSSSNASTILASTSKHFPDGSNTSSVSSTSKSTSNPITPSNHPPSSSSSSSSNASTFLPPTSKSNSNSITPSNHPPSSSTPNFNVDREAPTTPSPPLSSSVSSLSAASILAMSIGMIVEFMTVSYAKVGETLVPTLFKSNSTLFHIFVTLNLVSITSIVVLILIWLLNSQKMPRWMEHCLFQLGLIPLVVDCYIFIWVIFPDHLKYIPCALGLVVILVALYLYFSKWWEIYIQKKQANATANTKSQ